MPHQIYNVQVKSPMGIKEGRAKILLEEGRIVLELLGSENLFDGSFVSEYVFQTEGTLTTALNTFPATLLGSFSGDTFRAVLRTEQGSFPMKGVLERTEPPKKRQKKTNSVTAD